VAHCKADVKVMTEIQSRNRVGSVSQRILKRATEDIDCSKGRSQLSIVAGELCWSLCEVAATRQDALFVDDEFVDEFIETHAERVRGILTSIPSAFHRWVCKTSDGRNVLAFDMKLSQLLEAARDFTDATPEQLAKAYGTVWMHVRAVWELKPETQSKLKRESFLHCHREGVECVADLYLAEDDFVSPLLEWAIVDALVFSRITDFALGASFTGNLPAVADDQMNDAPLLPGTSSFFPMGAKFRHAVGGGLVYLAMLAAFEAAALAGTWWLSNLLADGPAKWMLFTGATAARWVYTAIPQWGADARERRAKGETNLQMLWDMGIAHERVPSMNVELLRHLFYRLEERGAAFSPVIYAILDRRARREAAARVANPMASTRVPATAAILTT
jgi:hypothetical protein